MTDNWQVRDQLEPQDVPAIRALVERTGVFYPEETVIAEELVQECLDQGAKSYYRCLVAEQNHRLGGYACYVEVGGTLGTFELYWLAVDPAMQGQGIGLLLLQTLEDRIRMLGGLRIYIATSMRDDYLPARSLYAKAGYRQQAILTDYYRTGDHLVYFNKDLSVKP